MIVSFEGMDGSGKSLQATLFARKVNQEFIVIDLPQFPPPPKISQPELRVQLFQKIEEYRLSLASMWTAKHRMVVLDRSCDTTYAYSGLFFRKAEEQARIEYHENIAAWFHNLKAKPDITFFFDASYEVCKQRLKSRQNTEEEFDMMPEEAWEFVRARYGKISGMEPFRFHIISASAGAEAVHEQVMSTFNSLKKELS